MTGLDAKVPVKELVIEAVVLGPCKVCGVGAEFHPDEHLFDPTFTRDLGVVSFWHRNPLKRAYWKLTRRN